MYYNVFFYFLNFIVDYLFSLKIKNNFKNNLYFSIFKNI